MLSVLLRYTDSDYPFGYLQTLLSNAEIIIKNQFTKPMHSFTLGHEIVFKIPSLLYILSVVTFCIMHLVSTHNTKRKILTTTV